MWEKALQDALFKTKQNIRRFGDRFPHVSENGNYRLNDNDNWTGGFWSGILWLCYEYSRDEEYRNAARKSVQSFRERLEKRRHVETHDIGFLYILSAKAQWLVEQEEAARELALRAADLLMERWRPEGEILQAWGPKGDPDNGGRIIIDCMMNISLLYWAAEQTGKDVYRRAALRHAEQSRRYLMRGDDSTYHTFYFDQKTGEPIRGATQQGYADGSTWTRGQAWAVYGFALSYRYAKNPLFLETARRAADYFLARLPDDRVVYWDFDVPVDEHTSRDSSASAIVTSGLLELSRHLDENDQRREEYIAAAERILRSLVENYSTVGEPDAQGLIKHGSYSVRENKSPDDFMIWGDYFYLESLLKLEKGMAGYF